MDLLWKWRYWNSTCLNTIDKFLVNNEITTLFLLLNWPLCRWCPSVCLSVCAIVEDAGGPLPLVPAVIILKKHIRHKSVKSWSVFLLVTPNCKPILNVDIWYITRSSFINFFVLFKKLISKKVIGSLDRWQIFFYTLGFSAWISMKESAL